jgi:hypothetical protein
MRPKTEKCAQNVEILVTLVDVNRNRTNFLFVVCATSSYVLEIDHGRAKGLIALVRFQLHMAMRFLLHVVQF